MSKFTLRKENVVKAVDSEDAALRLELRGFIRDSASASVKSGASGKKAPDVPALMQEVKRASEELEKAIDQRVAAEKELAEVKEQLKAANKENASLKQELQGTKEQLEAAVKKAAAPAKKGNKQDDSNDT